jgi:hypothetical protein
MEVTVTLQLQLLLLLTSFSPLPYVQSSSTGGGRQAGEKSKPPAEISKAPKKILSPSRTRLTAAAEASSSPQASSSSPSTSSSALKTTKIPSTLVRQFLEPCIKDAALPQKVVTVITEQFFGRVKKLAEGSRIKVLNFLERFHVLQAHDQQRRCVALFRKGLNSEKQAGPPPLHHHQFRSADSVNHYQDLAEAVERGTKTYAKVSEKKRTNMM